MKPTWTLHAAASPAARRGSISPAALTSDRTQAQSARRSAAAAAHVPEVAEARAAVGRRRGRLPDHVRHALAEGLLRRLAGVVVPRRGEDGEEQGGGGHDRRRRVQGWRHWT